MRSAAPKTYISKRMLASYSQRRQDLLDQRSENTNSVKAPVVPPKTFTEDEESKTVSNISAQAAQGSTLAPIEEEKKELEQTGQVAAPETNAVDQQQIEAPPAKKKVKKQKKKMASDSANVKQGFFAAIGSFFSKSKAKDPQNQMQQQASDSSSGSSEEIVQKPVPQIQITSTSGKKRRASQDLDRNLSCEEMDSDELDGDLNLSDEEPNQREQMRQRTDAATKASREQYAVEFDTNIFRVSLDCLQNRGQLATGDAEFCAHCKAVFNQTSVLVEEDGKQIWTCEFCNHKNEVMIGEEEIPQATEMTYLLEAPAQVEQAEEEKKAGEDVKKSDKISVVFCIDISGSMQSGGRLDACKQAIAGQITAMHASNPDRKLGLVTFENAVEIIGDGVEKPMSISGYDLEDYDATLAIGLNQGDERLRNPISETKDQLMQKVAALHTKGRTALGPAVLASVAMASKGAPGSQVIICTDGMANVGIGSFGFGFGGQQESAEATAVYDKIGGFAEQNGVMINLVTIAGCEANIQGLSRLVELSGGQIEQVNPAEISGDFANILSQKAIATKVEAKVKIHKGLQFRNELETDLSADKTVLTRRFGNVTTETMFTFEYGMKPISELLKMEDFDMAAATHFPFQAQVTYTSLDGGKYLRVITQKLEISNERDELTEQADAEMVQQNVLMQGSKQARAGNTRKAQAIMKTFQRKTKGIQSEAWQVNRADFQAQTNEVYSGMNMQAASMKAPAMQSSFVPMNKKQRRMRGGPPQMMQMQAMDSSSMNMMQSSGPRMDDRMASQMYQMSTKAKRSKY